MRVIMRRTAIGEMAADNVRMFIIMAIYGNQLCKTIEGGTV